MNVTHNQEMKQESGGYSPTGLDPSTTNWLGQYHFDVNFTQLSLNTKNKHWDYSKQLQKLFIDMNKFFQVRIFSRRKLVIFFDKIGKFFWKPW